MIRRVIMTFILVTIATSSFGLSIRELNPFGRDGWGQRTINEGKRVKKRVEKQINRTDEDFEKISKKVGVVVIDGVYTVIEVAGDGVTGVTEEVARYFHKNYEELEGSSQNQVIEVYYNVRVWNLHQEGNLIFCRPISDIGLAEKDQWIFDIDKFEDYKILEAGTVKSAFNNHEVKAHLIQYKMK